MLPRKTISTAYKQLGFREFPFSTSADPRFLYLATQHHLVLEKLQALIEARQGLCVVDGNVGVGKSSEARRLYDILTGDGGDSFLVVHIPTAVYRTAQDVLADIAIKLGVPAGRSQRKLLDNYEKALMQMRAAGQTPVVILDDAQMMRPACLDAFQYLYNFDIKDKLLQVIMFGQNPELGILLAQNGGLMSRIVSWQTILPLDYPEAVSMINFRCAVAGRSEPLLEESAFENLFEFSEGIPRVMVIICSDLLLALAEANRRTAILGDVEQAIRRYEQRYHATQVMEPK
jgi:general secretion pathway protein A